jgi:hypothetical protein
MSSIRLLIVIACLAGNVFADMVVEQKLKSDLMPGLGEGSTGQRPDSAMTMTIKGEKARIDLPGSQMSSIIDLKSGKMYTLDHKQKQVIVMSLDDLKKAADLSGQEKAQGKPTVTKTGKTETIKGYKCAEYEIKGAGPDAAAIRCWITEDVDDAEMAPFQSFGGRMGGFLGLEGVQKPKGMVMRSESKMNVAGRSVNSSTEVQAIKKGPVAESLFVPPADYKVMEMPKFTPPPPAE